MDRKQQLSNVAFGGAWSEQLAADEALANALARLDGAAIDTMAEDLRGDSAVDEALAIAAASHPKGAILVLAWQKGLKIENAVLRGRELQRLAATFRAGIGVRVPR